MACQSQCSSGNEIKVVLWTSCMEMLPAGSMVGS